ncbi:MAG: hypothetical protein IPM97_12410 [Bdellovibrionaceae bacterium]|nr:hypothetical protein [Pseudobdellovibrionaceae bacterium]
MKTKFILALFTVGLSLSAFAGAGDENSLLFEFKKQVTCETAKNELSNHKVEVECDRADSHKKRFFGGRYLGKKPVNAIISELKKNSRFVSITQNKPASRIQ